MADEYESKVKVTLDPGATAATEAAASRVEGAFRRIHAASAKTRDQVLGLGSALLRNSTAQLGLGLGAGLLVRQSIMANRELATLQRQVTGTLMAFQNWKPGVDAMTRVQASMRDSKDIILDLEAAEERLAIPLNELAGAFSHLGGTVMQKYGASQKMATDLVEDLAGAAKVLGIDTQSAAQSITRLLETRNLRGVDPLTNFLRSSITNTKALKSMAPDKLIALVGDKLHSLGPAAETLSHDFEGTIFRLKDFFEDTLRDIGAPSFKFIGDRLEDWRKHLTAVNTDGRTMAEVYGERVLNVVQSLEKIIVGVASHWKEIAMVMGGLTLSKLLGQTITWIGSLKEAVGLLRAGVGLAGGRALAAGGLVGAAVGAGWMLNRAYADHTTAVDKANETLSGPGQDIFKNMYWANRSSESPESRRSQAESMLKGLSGIGAIDAKGGLVPGLAKQLELTDLSGMREQMAQAVGANVAGMSAGMSAALIAETFAQQFGRLRKEFPELWEGLGAGPEDMSPTSGLTKPGKPKVEFTGPISIKQEFKEADPDNVFVRFKEDLGREAIARTQSELSDPLGP